MSPAQIGQHRKSDCNETHPVKIDEMRIPLFHVDAFTDRPFMGNPAAVCILDFWLDDGFLRKVAAENNLPATAFLVPSKEGYDLRWFSPVCELKLCGHATLAAAFAVFRFLNPELARASFSTRFRGDLNVRKDGQWLSMDFPALAATSCTPGSDLLNALRPSLQPTDIIEVLGGNETFVVLVATQDEILNFRPDFAVLESLHPQVVAITAKGDDVDFVSRYFAPGYGIPEDQVTGSSHCLLAPIWAKRLGKTALSARQLSVREGELKCELMGDRVILRGRAVPILQGFIHL